MNSAILINIDKINRENQLKEVSQRVLDRAKVLVYHNYSDAYIETTLWAERDSITSIKHITLAIEVAKESLNK